MTLVAQALYDLTNKYFCVVIIGTDKNAGKTTALNSLIARANRVLGITGIGRDGESADVVFGTPKPKIFVPARSLVATARDLLCECTCSRRILCCTGINTPLGEVVIFRAEDAGYVQIAGPSIVSQLVVVKNLLRELGAQKIFVDGALDRKSFSTCSLADAVILASGASLSPNCDETAEETAFIADTFFLPKLNRVLPDSGATVVYADKRVQGDILDLDLTGAVETLLSGALSERTVSALSKTKTSLRVVVADPGKIIVGRKKYLEFISKHKLAVVNRPELIAVCANPTAPRYKCDPTTFAKALKRKLRVPVFDVVNEIYL